MLKLFETFRKLFTLKKLNSKRRVNKKQKFYSSFQGLLKRKPYVINPT